MIAARISGGSEENTGARSSRCSYRAAVEQQRLPLPVPGVLHLPHEQRVVPAPVRTHDARHQVGEGAANERGLVDDVELDLLGPSLVRPAKRSESARCSSASTLIP